MSISIHRHIDIHIVLSFMEFAVLDQYMTSLVAQMVKNTPAVQETWVRSLDQEDPLEEGLATHSSVLA